MHLDGTPGGTKHHLRRAAVCRIRIHPARIGGHSRSHSERRIRHRTNDGMLRICRLDLCDRQPRNNREDECPLL